MERRTYTVTKAATVLGISRTSAYNTSCSGKMPALGLGRRIVITRAVVDVMLGGAPNQQRGADQSRARCDVAQGAVCSLASSREGSRSRCSRALRGRLRSSGA